MKNYYTAAEAYKKLGIPRSTFYHLIKIGDIPEGVMIPLRKQALYRREDIDRLVEERARYLENLQQEPERLQFVLPTREDLIQLVDLDREVFQEQTLILPEEQQRRFTHNPEAMHVLKDNETHRVVGGITMSPIHEKVLQKLIALDIDETQVEPEDYRPFTTEHPQDCYLIGIIVQPGIGEEYYGSRLLYSTLNYLIELLERGIIISRIYTTATTSDGEQLAKKLHFTRLPGEWHGEHEDFRHPYVLDLETKESESVLVQRYIRHKKNRERRVKRYAKQAKTPLENGNF